MAEESISSTAPELIKATGGYPRRHSTGKSSFSDSGEYIPPHYLRASTGSCHDFCKYGRKHAIEEIERRPMPKRITAKPTNVLNMEEGELLAEKKKPTAVKSNSLPIAETHVSDPLEGDFLARRKKASLLKLKSIPISRTRLSDVHELQRSKTRMSDAHEVPKSKACLSDIHEVPKSRTRVSDIREVPKFKTKVPDTSKAIKQETSSSENVRPSLKNTSSKAKDSNMSAKRATSSKPKSPTVTKPAGGLSRRRNSDIKVGKATGTSMVAEKKKLTPPVVSPRPFLNRAASSKVIRQRNLKVGSPLKTQNKIRKSEVKQHHQDEVKEKTLYVITMETEKKPSESDQNGSCEEKPYEVDQSESSLELSPPPPCEFDQSGNRAVGFSPVPSPKSPSQPEYPSLSSHDKEKVEEELEDEEEEEYEYEEEEEEFEYIVSGEDGDLMTENTETTGIDTAIYKGMPRKAAKVHAEDIIEPAKLSFRRGKVVDIRSENNGPRRLKFRRGRVLGDNQNTNAGSRSFKMREVEGETNDSEAGSEQVVLRHQDVQGKKDAKGLLNNVIEETASKLVGTKKSKVKALVGAFETVISLNGSKPSANTVN